MVCGFVTMSVSWVCVFVCAGDYRHMSPRFTGDAFAKVSSPAEACPGPPAAWPTRPASSWHYPVHHNRLTVHHLTSLLPSSTLLLNPIPVACC